MKSSMPSNHAFFSLGTVALSLPMSVDAPDPTPGQSLLALLVMVLIIFIGNKVAKSQGRKMRD